MFMIYSYSSNIIFILAHYITIYSVDGCGCESYSLSNNRVHRRRARGAWHIFYSIFICDISNNFYNL